MKRLLGPLFLGALLLSEVWAQTPTFTHTWTEAEGLVAIPAADLPHFGETAGHFELDWTPGMLIASNGSQQLLDIPNHLALWIYEDGIHGHWFNDAGNERLFRTRWGLPAVGVQIQIAITWNSAGYAVIVDGILRIHDWQTLPTTVYPDVDIVDGYYGASATGSRPSSGSFELRFYDGALSYDSCSVDTVGTINEFVPYDNLGSWSQGIDPSCTNPDPDPALGAATLSWVPPTQNEDGTPLTNLEGYKIYYGLTQSGPYPVERIIFDQTQTTVVIENLAVGTWYFVSTAFNTDAVESTFSNEVSKVVAVEPPVDPPIPLPPTMLVVVETLAYSVSKTNDAFLLAAVGTVPLGTACDETQYVRGVNEDDRRHVVPVSEVDSWFGSVRSELVVAVCQ